MLVGVGGVNLVNHAGRRGTPKIGHHKYLLYVFMLTVNEFCELFSFVRLLKYPLIDLRFEEIGKVQHILTNDLAHSRSPK